MVGSIPIFSDFFPTGKIFLFHEKLFSFRNLPPPQLKVLMCTENNKSILITIGLRIVKAMEKRPATFLFCFDLIIHRLLYTPV